MQYLMLPLNCIIWIALYAVSHASSELHHMQYLMLPLNCIICSISCFLWIALYAVCRIYPELVHIPGFQPIVFSGRTGMRGGGVGFYIRDGLNFEKLGNLSPFHEKTFECLTIELQYPNKKIIVSNIYRSPNPPPSTLLLSTWTNSFYYLTIIWKT